MTPTLARLPSSEAVACLTTGIALISVELNIPGTIFPGALGLLLTLLALASLLAQHPQGWALAVLALGSAILLLQLRRNLPVWAAALATVALLAGFLWLFPAGAASQVNPAIACICALLLGTGTTVLTRIARRARLNKGLD